jgi:hypothetical protein
MSSLSLHSPLISIPLFTALSFLIVGSPVVYKFTDAKIARFLKLDFADENGNPTNAGLVVHAIVLAILVYVFLRLYSPEAVMY